MKKIQINPYISNYGFKGFNGDRYNTKDIKNFVFEMIITKRKENLKNLKNYNSKEEQWLFEFYKVENKEKLKVELKKKVFKKEEVIKYLEQHLIKNFNDIKLDIFIDDFWKHLIFCIKKQYNEEKIYNNEPTTKIL